MTADLDDDDMTQLVDADFPRVDLVGKGANGIPRFLIAKQDEASRGLVPPDMVRELIGKQAEPETRDRADEADGQVTVKGSPAAIAKLIHNGAAQFAQPADGVAKAKNDTADRKHKAATGAAMQDGSYPIANTADLDKAIHAVGRGGSSHDAIRKHIISRARSLGASSKIPDNWNSDGSLKGDSVSKETETVAKDAGDVLDAQTDDGADGMDPTVPLASPDDDAPGDPTDPGSPAWEAIDAATACKWTSILARARVAIDLLADREMLEAVDADPGDAGNAYDLQDACCAIDYVIGVLAPYAVAEQSEADCGADEMAMIGKAMATDLDTPLGTVEALAQVRKAGRVLSAANEGALRSAAESINKVLASLPQAPTADDQVTKEATVAATGTTTETNPAGAEVAKAEETAATAAVSDGTAEAEGKVATAKADLAGTQTESGTTPPVAGEVSKADALPVVVWDKAAQPGMIASGKVTKAGPGQVAVFSQSGSFITLARPGESVKVPVAKADGDAPAKPEQVAVYDSGGNLVGVADPADITPLANVKAPAKNEGDPAEPKPEDAKPADAADLTPAPSAAAGTAADGSGDDDVAKAATTQTTEADGASTSEPTVAQEVLKGIEDMITAALGKRAPAEDEVAKSAAVAGLRDEIEVLKGQVVKLGEQPAMPKVFTNGATPPPGTLRGQDRSGTQTAVDVAKARERKAELYAASGPDQARIAKEMEQDAIGVWQSIRDGQPA